MQLVARVLLAIRFRVFRVVESLNRRASTVATDPFLDPGDFDWIAGVEAAAGDIVGELRSVQRTETIPNFQDVSEEQRSITDDDRWKTFFLYAYGERFEENCALCPRTDRALGSIPGMRTAMFSILEAGKTIPPHRGPYNGVLRYHLALVVPDDAQQCGIRVADDTRHWEVGRSLVFDDTYEHEAWNRSDAQRVVLFVDIERPMRAPMAAVNRTVIWAFRRTRFVRDGAANIRRHGAAQGAAPGATT